MRSAIYNSIDIRPDYDDCTNSVRATSNLARDQARSGGWEGDHFMFWMNASGWRVALAASRPVQWAVMGVYHEPDNNLRARVRT